jgi:hypothetical protein
MLRFIDKNVRAELDEHNKKNWSKKKRIELEYYYMHEWGKNQRQICRMLGEGYLLTVSENVYKIQVLIQHLTIMALMEYDILQS